MFLYFSTPPNMYHIVPLLDDDVSTLYGVVSNRIAEQLSIAEHHNQSAQQAAEALASERVPFMYTPTTVLVGIIGATKRAHPIICVKFGRMLCKGKWYYRQTISILLKRL